MANTENLFFTKNHKAPCDFVYTFENTFDMIKCVVFPVLF